MLVGYGALIAVLTLAVGYWLFRRWVVRQNEERGRGVVGIVTWAFFSFVVLPPIVAVIAFAGIVQGMIWIRDGGTAVKTYGESHGLPIGEAWGQFQGLVCKFPIPVICTEGWKAGGEGAAAKVGNTGGGGGSEYVAPVAETGGSAERVVPTEELPRIDSLVCLAGKYQLLYGGYHSNWVEDASLLLKPASIPVGLIWSAKPTAATWNKDKSSETWEVTITAESSGFNPTEVTFTVDGWQVRDSRGFALKEAGTGRGKGTWYVWPDCTEPAAQPTEVPVPTETPSPAAVLPPPVDVAGSCTLWCEGVVFTATNPTNSSITPGNAVNQTATKCSLPAGFNGEIFAQLNPSLMIDGRVQTGGPFRVCLAP